MSRAQAAQLLAQAVQSRWPVVGQGFLSQVGQWTQNALLSNKPEVSPARGDSPWDVPTRIVSAHAYLNQ